MAENHRTSEGDAGAMRPPPVPEQASASQSQPPAKLSFIQDLSKLTILAAFILYSLGFVIWHSYLASFGISSAGLLQAEYVSAALCYLMLVALYGLIPALMLFRIVSRAARKEKPPNIIDNILSWYLFSFFLFSIIFPQQGVRPKSFNLVFWLCFILMFSLLPISKVLRRFRPDWPLTRFIITNANKIGAGTYTVMILSSVVGNPNVSSYYLFSTVFMVGGPSAVLAWPKFRESLLKEDRISKGLDYYLVLLLLLANAKLFGEYQFGKISREVGGGKPEVAYLKFTTTKKEIPNSFQLPLSDMLGASNVFYGPVELLMRTEKEIVFINPAVSSNAMPGKLVLKDQSSGATALTNALTNSAPSNSLIVLNSTSTNQSATVATTPRISAIQLRSDLVEGIIFTK